MSSAHDDRDTARQLRMSFDAANPFALRLRTGRFLILIELNTPPAEQPFEPAVALATTVARGTRDRDDVAALAVTDRLRSEHTHDPVDTATALAEASGKPCILHLSGKGSPRKRIRDVLARARSAGIRNVLAVTGDRSDRHVVRAGSRRIPAYPPGYLDGITIMKQADPDGEGMCFGVGVNPFKYTPEDLYLQYYKLHRKLESGAEFVVTQAGWDMKKLQEFQWYLQMRDIGHAVVARLLLLSMDDIDQIHEGLLPGVHLSREFAAALQRESTISENQSMAAQLHRVALQVSGCKLLGYSGVQIAGVRDVQTLEMVLTRIDEAVATYTDYEVWVNAWNEHHASLGFAPVPEAYYAFDRLMQPGQQHYDPEVCRMRPCEFTPPTLPDRLRAMVLPRMLDDNLPAPLQRAARWLALRRWHGPVTDLRYCYHLDPSDCPKHLVYGACGGAAPDGTCEFGHGPCFFHRVIALAHARHEPDVLEEGVRP